MVSLPSPAAVVMGKRYVSSPAPPIKVSVPAPPLRLLLPLLPVITLLPALPVPLILDIPVRVRLLKFAGKMVVVEAPRSSLVIVPVTAVVVPTL